jgi:hypothetical protein
MSYGIARVNGFVTSQGFYGYQPLFLKVTGTGVGTADSVDGVTGEITEGNFTKAIRAIELQASVVYVGTRANNQFVVVVDGSDAGAYVTANTDTDVAAAIAARIYTATSVSTTVTDVTGLAAGSL